MAIQNIGYGLGSLASWLSGGSAESTATADAGQTRQNGTSRETSGGKIRRQVEELLADVPRQGDKLTFDDIKDYREERLEEFQKKVREGLEAMGVDLSTDLNLSYDANSGKVTAANHPDKAKVERFFESNPELTQEYADLLQLTKLTETADAKISPADMRRRIQSDMMSTWFSDNTEDFFGGSLAMSLASVNSQVQAYTGLSLRI
ncbi:hypothetical protein V6C53_09565 [Desulfocurvibacter africanus]|uniref:hypothetical protein n=1 Tax=Desulfocurvibacter africanus TaxID=873 RepID=UPI002FDB193D